MKYELLGKSNIKASRVALGLMRIKDKTHEEAIEIISTALESGINFFDHADIYGHGESEKIFAKAMKSLNVKRESYYLQSKVGIVPGVMYDFSKEHILNAVNGILARLETPYLDSLLLHRADMLWEPEEIAEAFKILKASGKVKYFGVSNMNQFQISYLQSLLDEPLIVNQLQFSIMHANMITTNTFVNSNLKADGYDSVGVLDYLRQNKITVQAWSPFQYGRYQGLFIDNDKFPELNAVLDELCAKYNTSKTILCVAWILKHPAKMQVLVGTMTPSRIKECALATDLELSREDWYKITNVANGPLIMLAESDKPRS